MFVVFPETEADFIPQMEAYVAHMATAYWRAALKRPFSWQGFTNWWVSRRWVIPRDPRKEVIS